MSDNINIYSIPEEYKETWEEGIISAITQKTAHLSSVSKQISCNGEYYEMTSKGTLTIGERMERHEDKPDGQELALGNRRFYPNMFAGNAWMSKDDFILKGRLPIVLNDLSDSLSDAAEPLPDRVALGASDPVDKYGGNCIIAKARTGNIGDKSPYGGRRQGLMGINWTGIDGNVEEVLPQQPMMGDVLATSYADYSGSLSGFNMRKTNVIPVNFSFDGSAAESGLTEDKFHVVREVLRNKHIVPGNGEFCMAITPRQLTEMLTSEHMINALYKNSLHSTDDGTWVSSVLGIRFLVTPDVPIVNIGTESDPKWVRACPVWRASSLVFGTWKTPEYEFEKLQRKWDTIECSVQFAYGAGRRRMEDILTVHCAETSLDGLPA